jgi:NAD(P)-dependent dehydrogenase (short-subunit alcohol dehydrogenase family)
MSGKKTCVISGANSGIGRATAMEIARADYRTVLLCRRQGDDTVKAIKLATGNKDVHYIHTDFSDGDSIKAMADDFYKRFGTLDVLINNAGSMWAKQHLTKEGIEYTFAVNHLGYFLTTYYLMEALHRPTHARIINVASDAHRMGTIRFANCNFDGDYSQGKVYAQSKLANVLFTYTLAERLAGTGITVNCLHPGVVASGFGQYASPAMKKLFSLLRPFLLTPEKGARTTLYLALSDEAAGITGKYFKNKKQVASSALSYDKDMQTKLWALSEELTGIQW